jgi:hypothetical protein
MLSNSTELELPGLLLSGMPIREHSFSGSQVWKSVGFWQHAGGGEGRESAESPG